MTKNEGLEVDLWGWVMYFFSPMSGVGHQNFVPLKGGGLCFFEEPGFHFLRPTLPLYFLTSPLACVAGAMLNKFKRRRKIGGTGVGGGGGRERPPARKLAFSSSPYGWEILIGSLNVNVKQNLSAE